MALEDKGLVEQDKIQNYNFIANKPLLCRYNLQLFAKSDAGEKTEEPTAKKLLDARKEGQVAKSQELNTAVMLFMLFLVLKLYVGLIGTKFLETFSKVYENLDMVVKNDFPMYQMISYLRYGIIQIIVIALPIYLGGVVVAFIVNKAQIKWKVTTKPLKPKLSKLNPIKGFGKMFSKQKLMELLFSVAKIILIGVIVYNTLKDQWGVLFRLYDYSLTQALSVIGSLVITLGLKISAFFLIIGFADLLYQKKKFTKDMRMSKQEIKDEFKNSEGDPQIKGKIRSKMQEASRRRMMNAIPTADVVITNPTHFAVALYYDREAGAAPVVVAKGADYIAQKIKEVARENQVEIVENKPLARMLYFNVDLDQEIPQELYQMVAEILAYVYRIKNKV